MHAGSELSLPDPLLIATTLRTQLGVPSELMNMVALARDASNRRYFRLSVKGNLAPSLILMQLAAPEGMKASEEMASRALSDIQELPFLNILRALDQAEVSVPTLYYYDEVAGLLYLEDFGEVTLFQACLDGGEPAIRQLYPHAIDTLVQIHLSLKPEQFNDCLAFSRSFDVPLLMWEFEHFLEYGLWVRYRKQPMCVDHETVFRTMCASIADVIAEQPTVFTHRDYHSRNLMISDNRLGVIDFQDALMGPVTYDLASLLRDSYIALDETFIDTMIDRYIEGMCTECNQETQERFLFTDRTAFRRLFDLTSIQRNLKAAGRFVYLDHVKGHTKFLADLPRTLNYVRLTLDRYPELEPLRMALTPYVPEWH